MWLWFEEIRYLLRERCFIEDCTEYTFWKDFESSFNICFYVLLLLNDNTLILLNLWKKTKFWVETSHGKSDGFSFWPTQQQIEEYLIDQKLTVMNSANILWKIANNCKKRLHFKHLQNKSSFPFQISVFDKLNVLSADSLVPACKI